MKRTLSAAMSLLLAAVSASAQIPASALTRIGAAAAVAGVVKAVSPGAAVGHVISSGKPLFLNDHVTTGAAGRLQVMLLDETVFTLGPESDMVLDEFVYDPKTSAGKIAATISKGAFRFVTGKVAQSDPTKVKIKLAVGTIGIRGSIGVGETGPGGTTVINGGARNPDNHDDSAGIYAQSGGRTVNLTQPGVGTHISPDGRISDASFMTGELNRIMGALQTEIGKAGGRGGEPAGAGRRTATDASGRSTSVGGLLAQGTADSADLISNLDSTLVNTVQGINGGSVSTWDSIRSLTSGTGSYSATGPAFCVNGLCGSGATGTWDFNLQVNFAQQTVVGSIAVDFSQSASFTDNTGLQNVNYGTYGGRATHTLASSETTNTSFAGSAFTLSDRAGTIAKDMTMTLKYVQNLGPTITGNSALTGSR